ncbi:MAG TPA: hypothetical protein VGJ11_07260 [Gaiellales bacterium]
MTLAARLPGLYVRGDLFSVIARAMSLFLAFLALVLGFAFVFVLPATGRLTLGDGLTFVGFLLTAASFFATAGKPEPTAPLVVGPAQRSVDWNEVLRGATEVLAPKKPPASSKEPPEPDV